VLISRTRVPSLSPTTRTHSSRRTGKLGVSGCGPSERVRVRAARPFALSFWFSEEEKRYSVTVDGLPISLDIGIMYMLLITLVESGHHGGLDSSVSDPWSGRMGRGRAWPRAVSPHHSHPPNHTPPRATHAVPAASRSCRADGGTRGSCHRRRRFAAGSWSPTTWCRPSKQHG
jgi:hypothetical protein